MRDTGFEPQIRKVLAKMPRERQTLFCFHCHVAEGGAEIGKRYS